MAVGIFRLPVSASSELSTGYRVRFIGWDGTIIKTQYVSSGAAATAPTAPTIPLLTFSAWNNTFTNVTGNLDVGATYTTTSGRSYLFIFVNANTGLSPTIYLNKATTALMTVYWGDGNTSTSSSSGNININHTYAIAGNYTIEIECSGGYGFGNGSSLTTIFSNGNYSYILYKVLIGSGVTSINSMSFYSNFSLRYILIPPGVTSLTPQSFSYCVSFQYCIIPLTVTSIPDSAFYPCLSLRIISISSSVTSISEYAISGSYNLRSAILPPGLTALNGWILSDNPALEDINVPPGVISIGSAVFKGTKLSSVLIPSTVSSLGNYLFWGCSTILDYQFLSATPPTMADTNVFNGINLAAKIYVPDASVSAYKTATNWATYANYIYPLSTRP